MRSTLLALFLTLFAFKTNASILIGTGFNSATSGRLVPTLNLGIGDESFEAHFSSVGVSTTAYSHSSYRLSGYWTWNAGEFLFGQAEAGFGASALYGVRSFQDSGAERTTKNDYVVGPAFFVRWVFWDPVFIAVDGLYGLIGPSDRFGDLLGLNARDNVSFIVGFRI